MVFKKKKFQLEKEVPFAKSVLWDIQSEYYTKQGLQAWNSHGAIPHYVSSNPTVANSYAEIALGFFRDRRIIAPDNTDPIYFLEVGAGSGRFAYHFIKQFTELYDTVGATLPPFCYVMTDLSPNNVAYWKDHPRFKPYIERGVVDFAEFDVSSTEPIQLEVSGKTLSQGALSQPLIVIANYILDSIVQELLYFKKGSIYECLTTTTTTTNPKLADVGEIIKTVNLEYTYRHLESPIYDLPELNVIVEAYREDIQHSHVYVPTDAIRCIHHLRTLSDTGLMLLTADKSQHTLAQLDHRGAPNLVTHGGSFSLTVNYHAIGQYVENAGGRVMFPEQPYFGLNYTVMLLVDQVENYTETQFAQARFVDRFGPDDFFSIKKHFDETLKTMSIRHILAYIRLSHYDARLFFQLVGRITNQLEKITDAEKGALIDALYKIWDMYYYIGERHDLAFELGMILYELDQYDGALTFFQYSTQTHEVDIATLFNMSVCYLQVGDIQQSSALIEKILETNPTYEPALEFRERIQAIVEDLSSGT